MTAPEARVIDHLSTGVVLLNAQWQIAYINSAAEALFGRSKERALGQPVHRLFPDDQLPKDLSNRLKQQANFAHRDVRWTLAADQEPVALDYILSDLVQDNQHFRLLEIHPRDRLSRIQRDATLSADYQHTRSVVRGLAHEVKNPLGGIRGAAQLLQRVTPQDQQEYTQIIIDEVDRLRNLVDRLLGPINSSLQDRINIHRIIERVITLIEAQQPHAIRWQRDYDPSLPEFSGDPEQIHQVILNLVANAQQALTEANTQPARITLRTRAGHQVTLSGRLHKLVCQIQIIDNGPGIPETLQPTLFYPMVSGRPQGTGLGLSLAQQYMTQQRGLITFQSQPGDTCFTLMLPMEHIA